MKTTTFFIFPVAALLFPLRHASSQVQVLDAGWHHIRNADPREWSEFPAKAGQRNLIIHFPANENSSAQALSLRQYDVKTRWKVLLNDSLLGELLRDEKDLIRFFEIPAHLLRQRNTLEISAAGTVPDDIKTGHIVRYENSLGAILSAAHISVTVHDAETGNPIPSRITITSEEGVLQTVTGNDSLAIRPGYVYTGTGRADIDLPAGTYILYAGRGFEYGIDSVRLDVKDGDHIQHTFDLRREVPTIGWVASDTHIHTATWSHHGDASAGERALTIAGEGLELPVITDHNINVDLTPYAVSGGVARYFTAVTGDEVTTAVGHFNVFPTGKEEPVIDAGVKTWKALSAALATAGESKAVILNHARDIHLGFRPFDPKIHLASAGVRLDGWAFPANAMEVMNSGSQQTDQMQLTRDWFGMLNHGYFITPVGASDSHDVSRYMVGQARTYIRCNDDDVGQLDVQQAIRNFVAGNVMVSFGLLAEIEVNDAYGPGELAPASDAINISVKVLGPAWTKAAKVRLYANGKQIREEDIENPEIGGTKWDGTWQLTTPAHDIFLVAVAEGPGEDKPYWPIAKPYQPASPEWIPRIFGISGAVWIDGDRNGKRNSALDYARALVAQAKGDPHALIQSLAAYDEAVAVQAAALLYQAGANLRGARLAKALRDAAPQTREGFRVVTDGVGGIRD